MSKNNKYVILGILGFITVITVQLLVRMFFTGDLRLEIDLASVSDHYYDPAYIRDNGLIFSDYSSVKGLYLVMLSCAFKFFGNLDEVIIFYNVVLELLALIFIYFALRNIFGRICAFIVSLLVAAYPAAIMLSGEFTGTLYMPMWREDRILYLAGAIGAWIISLIIKAIKKSVKAERIQATEAGASESSEATDSSNLTSDGLKEDEIEIIDDGKENAPDTANTDDNEVSAAEADDKTDSAEEKEEEDYSKYYVSDASLRVVLSEEGMVVEEYRTGKPDIITPDTVIASEHPDPDMISSSAPVQMPEVEPVSKPVELLKNPLPLPKKPEHKDMGYDYNIDPAQMKYDIDTDGVSEYDYE